MIPEEDSLGLSSPRWYHHDFWGQPTRLWSWAVAVAQGHSVLREQGQGWWSSRPQACKVNAAALSCLPSASF